MPKRMIQAHHVHHATGSRVEVLHRHEWHPGTVESIVWWPDERGREWPAYQVRLDEGPRVAAWESMLRGLLPGKVGGGK